MCEICTTAAQAAPMAGPIIGFLGTGVAGLIIAFRNNYYVKMVMCKIRNVLRILGIDITKFKKKKPNTLVPYGWCLRGNNNNKRPIVFDCRNNRYGHSNELVDADKGLNEDGSNSTMGFLSPLPNSGDFILKGRDSDGNPFVQQVAEVMVKENGDPRDMYLCKTFNLGSFNFLPLSNLEETGYLLTRAILADEKKYNLAKINYGDE